VCSSDLVENNLNDNSIVLRLVFGSYAFIFMGDAESGLEDDILAGDAGISSNVIKVGHHGSTPSTGDSFLAAVSPEIAVITVGKNNSYGHPSEIILEKLTTIGAEIYRTDIHGNISISIIGNELEVTTEKTEQSQIIVTEEQFIENLNSKVFHMVICGSLPAEGNRTIFQDRDEAISDGYRPCGNCRP
jgi:competence protein ComEC